MVNNWNPYTDLIQELLTAERLRDIGGPAVDLDARAIEEFMRQDNGGVLDHLPKSAFRSDVREAINVVRCGEITAAEFNTMFGGPQS